jgi:hypothetical protein
LSKNTLGSLEDKPSRSLKYTEIPFLFGKKHRNTAKGNPDIQQRNLQSSKENIQNWLEAQKMTTRRKLAVHGIHQWWLPYFS